MFGSGADDATRIGLCMGCGATGTPVAGIPPVIRAGIVANGAGVVDGRSTSGSAGPAIKSGARLPTIGSGGAGGGAGMLGTAVAAAILSSNRAAEIGAPAGAAGCGRPVITCEAGAAGAIGLPMLLAARAAAAGDADGLRITGAIGIASGAAAGLPRLAAALAAAAGEAADLGAGLASGEEMARACVGGTVEASGGGEPVCMARTAAACCRAAGVGCAGAANASLRRPALEAAFCSAEGVGAAGRASASFRRCAAGTLGGACRDAKFGKAGP